MAKVYGNRWKSLDKPLGKGGQSDVFRVVDTTNVLEGEFALKRISNPKRNARFRNEVEAIKRLDHPNIIKLIDHSALSEADIAEEKQFLVMPIAGGGDLSRPERLGLYTGSIDVTLQVAKQIAAGLEAAHAANVIHRDIKPQNILFTGNGHDTLITDFGICLIREVERHTPDDEVVGPRVFMAPELEYGGQLEVTPSVDIYALGKVIFYMFSGGLMIPRERLHEGKYASLLDNTERQRLLKTLLAQMICDKGTRIQTMTEVIAQLKHIEDWESHAHANSVTSAAMSSIERMQTAALEKARVDGENATARQQEQTTLDNIAATFKEWLRGELGKAATIVAGGGVLQCVVHELTHPVAEDLRVVMGNRIGYLGVTGLELQFFKPDGGRTHILQIHLCRSTTHTVTVTSGKQIPKAEPVRDLTLGVIPAYKAQVQNRHAATNATKPIYFVKPKFIGQSRQRMPHALAGRKPVIERYTLASLAVTFEPDAIQHIKFSASQWPSNAEALREIVSEAISSFFDIVEKDQFSIGS